MMREIAYSEKSREMLEILPKGAFLTTKSGDRINTMTIGWGSIGFSWGKPIFMVMVRKSRFTYELLEQSKEFTVSFPTGDLKAALGLCGSKSGRDVDKFKECGLTALPPVKLDTPALDVKGIHLECAVRYQNGMVQQNLAESIGQACYAQGDYHELYFAEIVACYVTD
jgi:flavin reductase (DIM6/NTAB) family NADH-FMN oxidoreductase RutF